MARFRKARRFARRFGRKVRRGFSGRTSLSPGDIILASAVYGVARPMVSGMIPPLFQFGPVSSDNAIIGAAGFLGMKQKNKFMRALGTVALAGEVSAVTATATAGMTGAAVGDSYNGSPY